MEAEGLTKTHPYEESAILEECVRQFGLYTKSQGPNLTIKIARNFQNTIFIL